VHANFDDIILLVYNLTSYLNSVHPFYYEDIDHFSLPTQSFRNFFDNNVYACALSALILLPVVNLSLETDSVTSTSYLRKNCSHSTLLLVYFNDFSLCMRTFDHITTSGLKADVTLKFSIPIFL